MVNSSPEFDVLGLGCATVDDLLYVEGYPPADTKVRVTRSERQCGGLTATALVAAARFGAKCAYGGQLGANELSRFVDAALQAEGIDTSIAPRRPDASPIHSTIIVDTVHHTRNIFFEIAGPTGADDELPSADVIRNARVLFVDHYGIPGNLRAIEIARAAGIPVVADVERDNVPRFYEMLPLIDHLIVSRRFASKLTGINDPGEAAAALMLPPSGPPPEGGLRIAGRKAAVVTDGEHGCWYCVADTDTPPPLAGEGAVGRGYQPAFPVDVVDTTGCGDVFHGVYAAALAECRGVEECVRFATAAAALKATRYGAQGGIPNRADVEEFIAGRLR